VDFASESGFSDADYLALGPRLINFETEIPRRGGDVQKPGDFCGENDNAGGSLSRRYLVTGLAAKFRSASTSSPSETLFEDFRESSRATF